MLVLGISERPVSMLHSSTVCCGLSLMTFDMFGSFIAEFLMIFFF